MQMLVSQKNDVALYIRQLPNDIYYSSIEKQKERLNKFCKFLNLKIVDEYIDEDYDNTPNFYNMVDDIKSKRFNMILTFDFTILAYDNKTGFIDENKIKLVLSELEKYDYELYLEDTFSYIPYTRPLFYLERHDGYKERRRQEKEKKKKSKTKSVRPMFTIEELVNPKFKDPFDWVEEYDDNKISFDLVPYLDKSINNECRKFELHYCYDKIVGFTGTRKKKKIKSNIPRLF